MYVWGGRAPFITYQLHTSHSQQTDRHRTEWILPLCLIFHSAERTNLILPHSSFFNHIPSLQYIICLLSFSSFNLSCESHQPPCLLSHDTALDSSSLHGVGRGLCTTLIQGQSVLIVVLKAKVTVQQLIDTFLVLFFSMLSVNYGVTMHQRWCLSVLYWNVIATY